MTAADGFKHLRLGMLGSVVLIEVTSKEIQGPTWPRSSSAS